MIDLTEAAIEQLNTICKEQKCYGVSLNLKGGGCAGFEYEWGTVSAEDVEENDHIIDLEHGKFVIGNASLMYLIGTTVDYKKDIMGAMFELDNPNAQSSCGCGVSVNFNDSIGGLF